MGTKGWTTLQSVKKSSKFELPDPPTDSHGNVIGDNNISIGVIDDVNKDVSSTSYKREKLLVAYEALEKGDSSLQATNKDKMRQFL